MTIMMKILHSSSSISLISFAIILLLTSCSNVYHDMPNSTEATFEAYQNNLEQSALLYYDCMVKSGIEMHLLPNSSGDLHLVTFSEEYHVLYRIDGVVSGQPGIGRMLSESQRVIEQEFIQGNSLEPALLIDFVDYSTIFKICLLESGYDENHAINAQVDPLTIEGMARQNESNNKWAHCARENGWPMIEDSYVNDELVELYWPSVVIPYTITEEQLRALLLACPTFDEDQADKLHEYYGENTPISDLPEWYLPDPFIVVAYPSFSVTTDGTISPEERGLLDHYDLLTTILLETISDYNNSRGR